MAVDVRRALEDLALLGLSGQSADIQRRVAELQDAVTQSRRIEGLAAQEREAERARDDATQRALRYRALADEAIDAERWELAADLLLLASRTFPSEAIGEDGFLASASALLRRTVPFAALALWNEAVRTYEELAASPDRLSEDEEFLAVAARSFDADFEATLTDARRWLDDRHGDDTELAGLHERIEDLEQGLREGTVGLGAVVDRRRELRDRLRRVELLRQDAAMRRAQEGRRLSSIEGDATLRYLVGAVAAFSGFVLLFVALTLAGIPDAPVRGRTVLIVFALVAGVAYAAASAHDAARLRRADEERRKLRAAVDGAEAVVAFLEEQTRRLKSGLDDLPIPQALLNQLGGLP